jgi:hypothetical protein|tara:strand:- start:31 stop:252 length:222 start_codon:yes stop_codon:yes gene_type:complete
MAKLEATLLVVDTIMIQHNKRTVLPEMRRLYVKGINVEKGKALTYTNTIEIVGCRVREDFALLLWICKKNNPF